MNQFKGPTKQLKAWICNSDISKLTNLQISNAIQSHLIPYHSIQYHPIPFNTIQHHPISSNFIQCYPIPSNITQYHQYHPNLICLWFLLDFQCVLMFLFDLVLTPYGCGSLAGRSHLQMVVWFCSSSESPVMAVRNKDKIKLFKSI